MKPHIFIAASTEGLDTAYAVQESLEEFAECTVWTKEVFAPSSFILPDLIEQLKMTDYWIFIFSIDDIVIIREQESEAVRDNVILELA